MIPTRHRFRGRASLRPVYQHGRTVRTDQIALRYLKNERRKSYRCAVVVSKKVSKSAVKRNRIRRRVYESMRLILGDTPLSYDLVVTIFGEQVAEIETKNLFNQISGLLKKAGIRLSEPHRSHDMIEET